MTDEDYKAIEEVIDELDKLLSEAPMPDENYRDIYDMTLILSRILRGRVVF